jgi:hypothetical protein
MPYVLLLGHFFRIRAHTSSKTFLLHTNGSAHCITIVATYLAINCMRVSCLPPVLVYFSFKRGVDVPKFSTTVKQKFIAAVRSCVRRTSAEFVSKGAV